MLSEWQRMHELPLFFGAACIVWVERCQSSSHSIRTSNDPNRTELTPLSRVSQTVQAGCQRKKQKIISTKKYTNRTQIRPPRPRPPRPR